MDEAVGERQGTGRRGWRALLHSVFFDRFAVVAVFLFFLNNFVVLFFLFLFLFFVFFFGEYDDVDGMHLSDLELDVALRAAQDFTLFYLVFVDIDLRVTIRTSHHGKGLLARCFSNPRAYYITHLSSISQSERVELSPKREYPDRPVVGVGGVVIHNGCVLLIRRDRPPLQGEWSIPGGTLELGESILEGIRRELQEETGIEVHVLGLIEVFDRIFRDSAGRIQYHFVIVDHLCELISGSARAASDVSDTAWVREDELGKYSLTEAATRVVRKAFAMAALPYSAKPPTA